MKEINIKRVITDTLIATIILTIAVYILVGPLNNSMQVFLKGVAENNGAISVTIYALPIILIIEAMIKLAQEIMIVEKPSNKKRKK